MFETSFFSSLDHIRKQYPHVQAQLQLRHHATLFIGSAYQGTKFWALEALLQSSWFSAPELNNALRNGTYGDLLIFRDTGEALKITDSKHIQSFVSTGSPYTKVVFIENIERCTVEAANSLLKLIEEPEASIVFVCTTEQPSSVLPTILSRMEQHHLPIIPLEHHHLDSRLSAYNNELELANHHLGLFALLVQEREQGEQEIANLITQIKSLVPMLFEAPNYSYTALIQAMSPLWEKSTIEGIRAHHLLVFFLESYIADKQKERMIESHSHAKKVLELTHQFSQDLEQNSHKKLAGIHLLTSLAHS